MTTELKTDNKQKKSNEISGINDKKRNKNIERLKIKSKWKLNEDEKKKKEKVD